MMTSTVMCNCGLWACSNSVVVSAKELRPTRIESANISNPIYQSVQCVHSCVQVCAFPTCVWQALVVVVLLCGRLQIGLILSHQLQLTDLSPSVLDSLWHLQNKHTAQHHSVYPQCFIMTPAVQICSVFLEESCQCLAIDRDSAPVNTN